MRRNKLDSSLKLFLLLFIITCLLCGLIECAAGEDRLQHKLRLFEKNAVQNFDADNDIASASKAINVLECGISKHNRQRKPRLNEEITANSSSSPVPVSASAANHHHQHRRAKIINGKESKPGAWPWQVSLELLHPKFGFVGHWCGGVLLSGLGDDYWVLTAAHCISNEAFSYPYGPMWTAVIGEHDRSEEEGHEQRIMVEKIYLHERFKEYHHDIALMKLQKPTSPINITERIRPICLPPDDDEDIFLGVRCIATGWGQSKFGGRLDRILHQTDMPVVDNSHCKEVYGTMYNIPIRKYHLCAGPMPEGGTGTCIGDSGGPLQCSLRSGRWYLAGVTSFGSGCAKAGFPDVFTRITYYLPWIRGKLRAASSGSSSSASV